MTKTIPLCSITGISLEELNSIRAPWMIDDLYLVKVEGGWAAFKEIVGFDSISRPLLYGFSTDTRPSLDSFVAWSRDYIIPVPYYHRGGENKAEYDAGRERERNLRASIIAEIKAKVGALAATE